MVLTGEAKEQTFDLSLLKGVLAIGLVCVYRPSDAVTMLDVGQRSRVGSLWSQFSIVS